MKTITVMLSVALGVLGGIAFAQNGETTPFAISEGIAAGIGAVALLLATAAGYGMAHQRLRSHVANEDIHRSTGDLDDRFVLRTEIADLKDTIKKQFDDLKEEIKIGRKEEQP